MTIINIIIMKTFERLRELPKCDTEAQSERTLMGKGRQRTRLAQGGHQPPIRKKHGSWEA